MKGLMPFGKYRDWPLCDVPLDYLEWALRSASLGEEVRELLSKELIRRTAQSAQ